jgi:hypothetical protein
MNNETAKHKRIKQAAAMRNKIGKSPEPVNAWLMIKIAQKQEYRS